MRSPPSFAFAYLPQRRLGEELERIAGTRLRTVICKPQGWLFTDRVKTEESALAKLQLSPVAGLGEMHDIYAATVVVPTKGQIEEAVTALREHMADVEVVERRRPRPEEFLYDDVHLLVRLGDLAAGLAPALKTRQFEVQIKTGLQFAWWRATHDVLYKGERPSYQLTRVGSQLRATLELIDAQLASLRAAAELQGDDPDQTDADYTTATGWLTRWDQEARPEDKTTFVACVNRLARAAGRDVGGMEHLLDSDVGRRLTEDPEVTPFQALLGAAVAEEGAAVVDRIQGRRFVLITPELQTACPAVSEVRDSRRARLA